MSKVDTYSRRIANYIYNDMDALERVEFEKELLNDADLAQEFKIQSSAISYLKAKTVLEELRSSPDLEEADRIVNEYLDSRGDLKKSDQVVNDPGPQKSSKHRLTKVRKVLYPVLAAAAIISGVLIIHSLSGPDLNERLFNKYYEPLDDVNFTFRGENNATNVRFTNAISLYNDRDYVNASGILASLVVENPGFPESYIYLALSRIGEGQYSVAADLLRSYLDNFEKYQPEAKWYLGMCYLKMDRLPEAHELLSELTSLEGTYGRDSKVLEEKLKKMMK